MVIIMENSIVGPSLNFSLGCLHSLLFPAMFNRTDWLSSFNNNDGAFRTDPKNLKKRHG